ncbi:macro domain-containing protein [Vibrio sp. WZ-1]|jgi:O-acetyl-ADP-ribose deacetylase (regulator of RNase III)|uniref:macro domain-containing protein n=1 Tax=Vibrio TaxID=662 RepID=UPI003F83405B
MTAIYLINGDITKAKVDAIVNAANTRMLGGGGVDGAIHKAAGPELLRACYDMEEVNGIRCPWGDARITAAGQLNARFVIHAVGPVYNKFSDPRAVLESAYQRALDLALDNDCQTVALPAISCGIFGYPPHEAAKIALAVCHRKEYQSLSLYFYLFGEEMLDIWQQAQHNFSQ